MYFYVGKKCNSVHRLKFKFLSSLHNKICVFLSMRQSTYSGLLKYNEIPVAIHFSNNTRTKSFNSTHSHKGFHMRRGRKWGLLNCICKTYYVPVLNRLSYALSLIHNSPTLKTHFFKKEGLGRKVVFLSSRERRCWTFITRHQDVVCRKQILYVWDELIMWS